MDTLSIQELNAEEVDLVSGGIVAAAGLLLAVIVNSDKLYDFFSGVFDGYGGLPKSP
jgi:hypothetical protein